MSGYEQVCFFVETHAKPLVELIETDGPEQAIRYLADLHHRPGKHEVLHSPGYSSDDEVIESHGYVLSYDPGGEYLGLEYKLTV